MRKEVILVKTSTGTFSENYMVQTVGDSKVFGGKKRSSILEQNLQLKGLKLVFLATGQNS